MPPICEAAILFKRENPLSSYISRFEPCTFMSRKDIDKVIMCSLPEDLSKNKDLIYAFTTDYSIGYVWFFKYKENQYSIVLLSQVECPSIFLGFLNRIKEYIYQGNTDIDPECRFNMVSSLINHWFMRSENVLRVYDLNGCFDVKIDHQQRFNMYEPHHYFSSSLDYNKIWKALITERGVFVTCEYVEDVAPVAFSLLSLISPFDFKGGYLITTNSYDPRIDNAKDKYSLVVVVGKERTCKGFELNIHSNRKNGKKSDWYRVTRQNSLLLDVVKHISDRNIEKTPYYECVGRPIITDEIDQLMCEEMKQKTLSFADLKRFEATSTFQYWLSSRTLRSQLRDSFLSNSPLESVSDLLPSELHSARNLIHNMSTFHQNDVHLMSVLRKHRRAIDRRLGICTRRDSDSSDSIDIIFKI